MVDSPGEREDQPVYFVTLNHEREQQARDEFVQALGQRLRTLRGERSRHEVAAYLGRHPNTIAKFERGDAVPDAWELLRLSRLYELPIDSLFDVLAEPPARPALAISNEFVMVPEYSVRASAGIGALVGAEDIVGRFAFRRSWLDSRGIKAEALAVVSAEGDSMEPTVRDSDILLVDTSVHALRADGIYLIEQAGELRCKRLQAMVGGGVKIRSDNPKYETEVVKAEQADLLRVVAKVIWIGGER
jgi:phage repressor protein C with HTH and peptisase S24 domain